MIGAGRLAFLDGYLFRVMVDMLRSAGAESYGLYDFYKARIEQEGSALSGYDRILFEYVRTNFDPAERKLMHAGIGLGTLASALSKEGFNVVGLERDAGRFSAATRVRSAVVDVWPAAAERYDLIAGSFPAVLLDTLWIAPQTLLVFTNCGSGWPDEFTDSVIALFPRFGDIILDTRLFGTVRDLPDERRHLIAKIEAQGLAVKSIPGAIAIGAYYYHIQHHQDGP
ncbi:MAG: hypothetical protein WCG92_23425 [Hyphomicrobiales bacterium]